MRKVDIENRPRFAGQTAKAPELMWVSISALRIDDAYQRPILTRGWKQIEWIANNFCWASFSPVLIAPIDDGLFVLIDGQHRAHAAYMAGYEKLPALCVEANQVEQAQAFTSVNLRVTKVTPHTVYKAALIAGEKWALECDRVVSEAGCHLMRSNASQKDRKPGEVYAVMLIRDMVNNMEGSAVTAGLKALRESRTGNDSDAWSMQILKPWLKAIASNSTYLHMDLKTALDKQVDLFLLHDRAARQAKENGESKAMTCRRLICISLDELRKKRASA